MAAASTAAALTQIIKLVYKLIPSNLVDADKSTLSRLDVCKRVNTFKLSSISRDKKR